MKLQKTLGEMVKHRRQTLSLTQRQLAEMLGVKGSHVAYLERGRRRPSLALLKRLADVLELDRWQLFLLAYISLRFEANSRPGATILAPPHPFR
jgi:transcriptional regulator with XRE-family HTH domain